MSLVDLQPGDSSKPPPRPPAPLVPVAIGLGAGIIADDALRPAMPVIGAVLALLASGIIATFARRDGRLCWVALLGASAGLGLMRHALSDRFLAPDHIAHELRSEPVLVRVRGEILTEPVIREPDPSARTAYPMSPRTRLLIAARAIERPDGPATVSGRVTITAGSPRLDLRLGDMVAVTGWLQRPRGPSNPGEFDWALQQRRAGVFATLNCDHGESIRVIAADAGIQGWRASLASVRQRLRGYLLDRGFEEADPGAGVMAAMVLGERTAVSSGMNESFMRTGNAHLLAASGMHVAWLALIGWAFARTIGLHYHTTAVFVAMLIVSYVLIAEPRPSILRAGIVGVLACTAAFFRGSYGSVNALALSAILILLMRPTDLFSPAFQFTYLATIGLLHFRPRVARTLARRLLDRNMQRLALALDSNAFGARLLSPAGHEQGAARAVAGWFGVLVLQLFVLSVTEWIITAPLACYHFNNFMPWGWLGAFAIWFLALPATCIGYVTVLLGIILPSSGVVMGPILGAATSAMTASVEFLARLPLAIVEGRSPSLWWVVVVYAALWIWCYRREWVALRWRHGYLVLAVVLVGWWLIPPRWLRSDRGDLSVWMLAVGHGTGTVIELPDGRALIYDFGTRSGFDAGPLAENFLRHRGIRRIDTIFLSHTDFDHYSAIEFIAERFQVGRVVVNDHFAALAEDQPGAKSLLAGLRRFGVPVEVIRGPTVFDEYAPVELAAVWPPAATQQAFHSDNDTSMVLRIRHGGKSVLLTGDIVEAGMAGMLAESEESQAATHGGGIRADVMALPHHGGVVHNTGAFIDAVDPVCVIRSTGQRRAQTTNGIEQLVGDRQYYSTADDGCVRVRISTNTLSVTPHRTP